MNPREFIHHFWGEGDSVSEEALAELDESLLTNGIQRRYVSLKGSEENRRKGTNNRIAHERKWAQVFQYPHAYKAFLDCTVAAEYFNPQSISLDPAIVPLRMCRFYRNIMSFNQAVAPENIYLTVPRRHFVKKGFVKLVREIFTDVVVAFHSEAQLKTLIESLAADPKVSLLHDIGKIKHLLQPYCTKHIQSNGYYDLSHTDDFVKCLDSSLSIDVLRHDIESAVVKAQEIAVLYPVPPREQVMERIKQKTRPSSMNYILNNGVRTDFDIYMRHAFLE